MALHTNCEIKQSPGEFKPTAQTENGIKDIIKLTRLELLDLKRRQEQLLANKKKINGLPDKGARLKKLYDKAVAELERRDSVVDAAALVSNLNLADRGTHVLDELEWNSGKIDPEALPAADSMIDVLDSDDEQETDPLRIIAQRRMHDRKVKVLPPEMKLITDRDLEEIKLFTFEKKTANINELIDAEFLEINIPIKNLKSELETIFKKIVNIKRNNSNKLNTVDEHVRFLVAKEVTFALNPREKFMPYKTTNHDAYDAENERYRKQRKFWENTAATPPPIQYKSTQGLSLLESLKLQTKYIERFKVLHQQQAVERLAGRMMRLAQKKYIEVPTQEELKSKIALPVYRNALNI